MTSLVTTRRCIECGLPQRETRVTTPYTESGLSNIELVNVPAWVCDNGHEEVLIPAVNQLHDMIADGIVRQSEGLSGPEVRFLRKRLGLSAKEFARRIGIHFVHLSRVENQQRKIISALDLLIRLFYASSRAAREGRTLPSDMLPLLERLERQSSQLHRLAHVDTDDPRFADTQHEWRELR